MMGLFVLLFNLFFIPLPNTQSLTMQLGFGKEKEKKERKHRPIIFETWFDW